MSQQDLATKRDLDVAVAGLRTEMAEHYRKMEASNAESLRKMEARVTGPEKKTAELFEEYTSKIINRMYLGLGAAPP